MTEWIEEGQDPKPERTQNHRIVTYDSIAGLPDNHVLTIRERRIFVDSNILIQNNVKTDTITLDLDAEWEGISPIIIFTDSNAESTEIMYQEPAVSIPASAQDHVGNIEVSVVGYNQDHTVRLVTVYAPVVFKVIPSGRITGSITPDEADDMLGQLAQAAEAADDAAAEALKAAADIRQMAESGEFDGEPGAQGPPGTGVPDITGLDEGKVLTVKGGTAVWGESSGSGGGTTYSIGHGLKLDPETNVLSVDTAGSVEEDNTLPITSAAVYVTVGNIDAILATI